MISKTLDGAEFIKKNTLNQTQNFSQKEMEDVFKELYIYR